MNHPRFTLVIFLFSNAALALAQSPAGKQPIPPPTAGERAFLSKAFLNGERRVAFPKNKMTWREVFEWLSDETGLIYIGGSPPISSFVHMGPEAAAYSCPELIDILNEALSKLDYTIIRRENTFAIIPNDDGRPDPGLVPRVSRDELAKRGKTEFVQVVVPLRKLPADELALSVKKEFGPRGEVVSIKGKNTLILTDIASSLLRVLETIDLVEKADSLGGVSYKCVYLRPSKAEQMLREFLRDSNPAIDLKAAVLWLPYIRFDDAQSILYVEGRPSVIAKVKSHLSKIDQPQFPGQRPIVVDGPVIRNYDVPAGGAEMLVRLLSNTSPFRQTSLFRMSAVSPTRVMVYGDSAHHGQFAMTLLVSQPLPPAMTEALALTFAQIEGAIDALHDRFGASKRVKAPK